jgi:hypothetical protein
MPIVTLAEAKTYLGIRAEDTTADADITRLIEAVTPVIEAYVGPVLPRQVSTEGKNGTTILEGRVLNIISVDRGGTLLTDYRLNAEAGLLYGSLHGAVVTYRVGMEPIPAAVQQAALDLVSARRAAHHVDLLGGADVAEEPGLPRVFPAPDSTILARLDHYRRGASVG